MITVKLQGGLGNQLFQIFTTIAHAFNCNEQFFFIYSETLPYGIERPTYWNNFLQSLKPYTLTPPPFGKMLTTFYEPAFHFIDSLPRPTNKDHVLMLDGYFQTPKYFREHLATIYKIIELEEQLEQQKMTSPIWISNTCSLHFRLGDYVNKQDYHTVLPIGYYINSVNQLLLRDPTIKHILVFNEENDREMVDKYYLEPLKGVYQHLVFHRINYSMPDWQQMLMMALCHHNIIGNSTFSWWGAFLGTTGGSTNSGGGTTTTTTTTEKLVFYPSHRWFGPRLSHHRLDDLFPDEWISVTF
jgi:hypothetical protein